jgi:hypothetical protein
MSAAERRGLKNRASALSLILTFSFTQKRSFP